jgi:hypothetical protein
MLDERDCQLALATFPKKTVQFAAADSHSATPWCPAFVSHDEDAAPAIHRC